MGSYIQAVLRTGLNQHSTGVVRTFECQHDDLGLDPLRWTTPFHVIGVLSHVYQTACKGYTILECHLSSHRLCLSSNYQMLVLLRQDNDLLSPPGFVDSIW